MESNGQPHWGHIHLDHLQWHTQYPPPHHHHHSDLQTRKCLQFILNNYYCNHFNGLSSFHMKLLPRVSAITLQLTQ